jgi:Bacterial Ig-like domain
VEPALAVTTTAAPSVVRFRPVHRTTDVARSAKLSVRFTQPMEHASTKGAFIVTANGKAVAGSVSFAEKSTVLVFQPSAPMPYGAEVEMLVKATARSAAGAPLSAASSVRIRIESEPVQAPTGGGGDTAGASRSIGGSAGAAVGGGSWGAVETYYLRLMNCTRTGGLVTSSGRCSSPGGRSVAALKLDSGISSKVARPYAKRLATRGQCSHFIGGNPGDRLRAAGYTSYIWAENLGCRSGDPYKAVLGSHLYFQSERSYSGGHWVNMMNAKYDRVGIGVWVSGGRVRLVVDFYHPR